MKLSLRYCQRCNARALTPKTAGRTGMRPGYVYRRGHDLCVRCFREARAEATRMTRSGFARFGPRPAGRSGRVVRVVGAEEAA